MIGWMLKRGSKMPRSTKKTEDSRNILLDTFSLNNTDTWNSWFGTTTQMVQQQQTELYSDFGKQQITKVEGSECSEGANASNSEYAMMKLEEVDK